jgi:hypothetical protein
VDVGQAVIDLGSGLGWEGQGRHYWAVVMVEGMSEVCVCVCLGEWVV